MKKKVGQLPSSVDFMLLGACNLRCSFCFGPQHKIPPINTDKAIEIIKKLAANGVKRIVFTGGEPTLIKDLPKILASAKNNQLSTVLATNGLLLWADKKILNKIYPYLDWLSLPLEGDTAETNALMRTGFRQNEGYRHYAAVLGLIPKIRQDYPNLKIKLGTVIARPNINHIIGIPAVLASHKAVPDVWKLYQVSPSEYAKANYSQLEVSNEEFEKIYRKALKLAKQFGIPRIIKYTNSERPGKYFFINPEGDVLIVHPKNNDYYPIGNILYDFDNLIKGWRNYINEDSLTKNFESTYPL